MSAAPGGNNIGATNNGDALSDSQLPSQYKVLSVSFNQDCTYECSIISSQDDVLFFNSRALAMGTMKAYSLFTINQKSKPGQNNDSGKHRRSMIFLKDEYARLEKIVLH